MAETWFMKASYRIRGLYDHENKHVRAVGEWEAGRLLENVLAQAEILVPALGEDQIEDVERAAKRLASAIRARRLAGKLAQTDGRTTEEAAAFRAKAAELTR